eukprot:gene2605-3066_t
MERLRASDSARPPHARFLRRGPKSLHGFDTPPPTLSLFLHPRALSMQRSIRAASSALALPTLIAAAFALPGAAFAQAAGDAPAPAASPVTANIALTTNYKFRGQDQDMLGRNDYAKTRGAKPAIQG